MNLYVVFGALGAIVFVTFMLRGVYANTPKLLWVSLLGLVVWVPCMFLDITRAPSDQEKCHAPKVWITEQQLVSVEGDSVTIEAQCVPLVLT